MIDVKINNISDILSRAMQVAAKRQNLLADNIANVDTPFYKRRDLNFKEMMEYILDDKSGISLSSTDERHFVYAGSNNFPRIQKDENLSWRSDRNNVDVDKELVELMQNSMWYGGVAQLLSMRFSTLRSILSSIMR